MATGETIWLADWALSDATRNNNAFGYQISSCRIGKVTPYQSVWNEVLQMPTFAQLAMKFSTFEVYKSPQLDSLLRRLIEFKPSRTLSTDKYHTTRKIINKKVNVPIT